MQHIMTELRRIADARGFPVIYKSDLDIDAETLSKALPGEHWLWFVRECGTELCLAKDSLVRMAYWRDYAGQWAVITVEAVDNHGAYGRVTPISPAEARMVMHAPKEVA